jgi:large subunit ribosomal protein L18Ae
MGDSNFSVTVEELTYLVNAERDEQRKIIKAKGGVAAYAELLKTSLQDGLSEEELTEQRAEVYGHNELPDPPSATFMDLLLDALQDPTVIILSVAAVISLVFGIFLPEPGHESTAWIEGAAILIAVSLVSFVGATNNYSKEKQFQAMREYQVVGRHLPTKADENPKVYRMRIFAPNKVVAKSRFWYYLSKLKKIKKSKGEILAVNEILEPKPLQIKNFGIFLRYYSRSGIHNMHKEYRDTKRVGAVQQMYAEMASRHRARFSSISIIEVNSLKAGQTVRPNIKQFHDPKIKFPLPHRVNRVALKKHRSTFVGKRPSTFW